jgi:hypothetical protein
MEQLDPTQRSAVMKMSTERLRIKLGKADFDEQLVSEMTREQLLESWAKCIIAGRDKPQAAAAVKLPTIGYDVELEKQRLAFEATKFEAELALRRDELAAAQVRFQQEEKRRQEEIELQEKRRQEEIELQEKRRQEEIELYDKRRQEEVDLQERRRQDEITWRKEKEAMEQNERMALHKLQEEELRARQQQWEWEKARDIREAEKQKTPAAQVKLFGDALKNVMPKFPTDAADIPVYFEGVEKLYSSFEVPAALQAKLLLPYLSDKAKSLLLRLEQSKQ